MSWRMRAERRRRRLGLKEVTSNARAWLLIGANGAGGGWKAVFKTFVCQHLRFCTFFLLQHLVWMRRFWFQLLHIDLGFSCVVEQVYLMPTHSLQPINLLIKYVKPTRTTKNRNIAWISTFVNFRCRKMSVLFQSDHLCLKPNVTNKKSAWTVNLFRFFVEIKLFHQIALSSYLKRSPNFTFLHPQGRCGSVWRKVCHLASSFWVHVDQNVWSFIACAEKVLRKSA